VGLQLKIVPPSRSGSRSGSLPSQVHRPRIDQLGAPVLSACPSGPADQFPSQLLIGCGQLCGPWALIQRQSLVSLPSQELYV
jgi:hypothetical protein